MSNQPRKILPRRQRGQRWRIRPRSFRAAEDSNADVSWLLDVLGSMFGAGIGNSPGVTQAFVARDRRKCQRAKLGAGAGGGILEAFSPSNFPPRALSWSHLAGWPAPKTWSFSSAS